MRCSVNVWVGAFGEYEIPDKVISQAKETNGVLSISDQRTKGFKILKAWGELTDKVEGVIH